MFNVSLFSKLPKFQKHIFFLQQDVIKFCRNGFSYSIRYWKKETKKAVAFAFAFIEDKKNRLDVTLKCIATPKIEKKKIFGFWFPTKFCLQDRVNFLSFCHSNVNIFFFNTHQIKRLETINEKNEWRKTEMWTNGCKNFSLSRYFGCPMLSRKNKTFRNIVHQEKGFLKVKYGSLCK